MNILGLVTKGFGAILKALGINHVGRWVRKLLLKLATNIGIKLAVAGSDAMFDLLGNTLEDLGKEISKKATKITTKLGKPDMWNDELEPKLIATIDRLPKGLESN